MTKLERTTLIGLVFVLVIAGVSLLVLRKEPASSTSVQAGRINFKQERQRVESLFDGRSLEEARDLFMRDNDSRDAGTQHALAHIFGDELYKRSGADGFSYCGSEASYGCAHSVIGHAIAEEGLKVLPKLEQACLARGSLALGCFHGLGHGVVSYFGYGPQDLDHALAACSSLSWGGTYGGCPNGAFMEYNFRTMEGDDQRFLRPFSYEDRYSPCDAIPKRYRVDCYFGQPEWWLQASGGSTAGISTYDTYCRELPVLEEKRACYRGIGYAYVPHLQFDLEKSIAACDALRNEDNARIWCREGIAWIMYATGSQEDATFACTDGLTDSESVMCRKEHLFVIEE